MYTDAYEGGLLVYGDLVNNTGASQEIFDIVGTFYDVQGQVVADETSTYSYWPVLVIPPGGRMPFELTVEGTRSADTYDLRVDAEPSGEVPRQDFEFFDLYQRDEGYGYCIGGTLRNPGVELQDDLVVVGALYDAQDTVIGFGEYYPYFEGLVGDQTEDFEVCADRFNQEVARYELRAWGQ